MLTTAPGHSYHFYPLTPLFFQKSQRIPVASAPSLSKIHQTSRSGEIQLQPRQLRWQESPRRAQRPVKRRQRGIPLRQQHWLALPVQLQPSQLPQPPQLPQLQPSQLPQPPPPQRKEISFLILRLPRMRPIPRPPEKMGPEIASKVNRIRANKNPVSRYEFWRDCLPIN
jgi:hypothetical protein